MRQDVKPLINWKLANTLAKLFVVLIILVLVWDLVVGIRSPSIEPSRVGDSSSESELMSSMADFQLGSWNLGGSNLEYKIYTETQQQGFMDAPKVTRQSHPGFDDQEYIKTFRDLEAKVSTTDSGLDVWLAESNGIAMAMFTRDEVVQAIRTRFPADGGYSVIELLPKQAEAQQHLMPEVAGVTQTAVRSNDQGQLTSTVLEYTLDKKIDIYGQWKDNGWKLTLLPEHDFVDANQQIRRYRCFKDGDVVEATFTTNLQTDSVTVILVRLALGKK
jgi:hypothetical protein